LLNVYVRNQMLLAHHMVQHPEYGKKYIAQVTAIIDGAYNLNVARFCRTTESAQFAPRCWN
jgi:hypothetical protein